MAKKILTIPIIIALVLTAASCAFPTAKITPEETESAEYSETESTAKVSETREFSESETETQTEESTTAPAENTSLTELPVNTVTSLFSTTLTTETAATRIITTRPATTRPTTTRPATTRPSTTRPSTSANYEGATKVQTKNVNERLKYGVTRTGTRDEIYSINNDGSVTLIGYANENITYNRLGYSASYFDLLPAAKENAEKYEDFIYEVLRLTNKMRAEKGLPALTLNNKLVEQASVRAEEIAWSGKHSHMRPGNKYYTTIFRDNGFNSGTAGENIGWGYGKPADVCTAWRNSETHYENIINTSFKSMGVGIAPDCDPSKKLCWVQHFYSE